MLRPHDREGGHPVDDPLPTFIADVEPHDITRLPHMHTTDEIEHLFPTIVAAPGINNDIDFDPDVSSVSRKGRNDRMTVAQSQQKKSDRLVALVICMNAFRDVSCALRWLDASSLVSYFQCCLYEFSG